MISRAVTPRRRGRRTFTALAAVSLITGLFYFSGSGLALTQSDFELDKNAHNDLQTAHLAVLKGQVSSTSATSIDVCLRQQLTDTDGNPDTPPVQVPQPIPAPSFTILVDSEQMLVTARSTPSNKVGGCSFSNPADSAVSVETWTVTRGADNVLTAAADATTAASHPGSSDVTWLNPTATTGDDWDQVHALITADNNDTGPDDKCVPLEAVECTWLHDDFNVSVFTTGGSKDDLDIPNWRHTDSSVPPSDEILDAFAVKYDTGTRQTLYFGADRWSVNGAKDFGFWFFKQPVGAITAGPDAGKFSGQHTVGDILILGTFTQGGAVATIRVYTWVGSGGDTNTVLATAGQFGDCVPGGGSGPGCNTVNSSTVPSPWSYQGSASTNVPNVIYAGGMLEGGIDLTAMGLTGCFSSFLAETRSAPSIGAQLKDFVLGNFESCATTLVTTPANGSGTALVDNNNTAPATTLPDISIGTGSVQVKDSAVLNVTGTTTFSGTLSFFICGPITSGACTSGGVPAGSQTVTTNGTYTSSAVSLTSVGRYCWRGEFVATTSGVPGATDASDPGECFEVLPVTPTLTTTATGTVEIGTAIGDTASLTGTAKQPGTNGGFNGTYTSINATNGANAAGTITFTAYGPNDATCAGTAAFTSSPVTVNGDGTSYSTAGFTPTAPGVYRWVASYSGNGPNTNGRSGACNDANETSTVVDARIGIAADDTNEVNDDHTFTVTVEKHDGSAWSFASGVAVTVTFPGADPGTIDDSDCAATDVNGQCDVVVNSTVAGVFPVHAAASISVGGLSLNRQTNGLAGNSGDATKTYVDAQIDLTPLTATNEVNDPHTITATVQQNPGTGWANAPDGTTVTFSLLNNTAGAAFVGGVSSCTTTAGSCSVDINTSTAGSVDIHATTTFTVGTVSLTRATGTGGLNSADANKVYVDAKITIGEDATNSVGDPHTFTVNVYQDDGLPASKGDGVAGWAPAPNGTLVTVTLTNSNGATNSVISNTCDAPDGTASGACTITFTSPTAGTVTGHASVTFSIGGESVTRETDGIAPNSDDAVKVFVAGSIRWTKVDNANAKQGGATFQLCKTHTYDIETETFTDITDACINVVDNSAPDDDADNGEFLVVGLSLGRYTVKETVAPPGFIADPDTETVELTPGDTTKVITTSFVNSRPILKITGFGYTNDAAAGQTSGIVSGETTFTVNLKNYGTADAVLSGSSLVASVTGAGTGTLVCNGAGTGGLTLAITGTIAKNGGTGGPYTLTCTYTGMADGAVISADLVIKSTTNGLTRDASGSPAKISFTVQAD